MHRTGRSFPLARQESSMRRKVDCVAYYYDRRLAAAFEIESLEHVFHGQVEQVV